ncbi:MAG: DUF3847 domain-containing protein [Clostridia bacterium]|nr:DUF3847 domain-containing protein [Clostridia bacterium]
MTKRMDQLLEKQKKLLAKKQQAEAEEKAVQKQIKELARNERTHRLCNRGGYVEKLLTELGAPELLDEEVYDHLKYALNTPYAKTHLANLLEAKRKAVAEAEGTETGDLTD